MGRFRLVRLLRTRDHAEHTGYRPVQAGSSVTRPAARQRNREVTRQRILQSALNVFAEKGYDGATTREIASRAGVNHSMIAHYYGSKEELWNSAVDRLFDESSRVVDLDAVERAANDIERFRLLVRQYVRYSARHPEHARLIVQESLRPGKRLRRIVARARRHHEAVAPLIRRLMDDGHIVRMDPVSVAYIFSSACQSVFLLAREAAGIYGRNVLSEAFIEAHVEAVVALFLDR